MKEGAIDFVSVAADVPKTPRSSTEQAGLKDWQLRDLERAPIVGQGRQGGAGQDAVA